MSVNPFDEINERLARIESELLEIKTGLQADNKIPDNSQEQPISTDELCKFLSVTAPTIIRWRKKGKIPFLQLGSRIMFKKSDVLRALEVKQKGYKRYI